MNHIWIIDILYGLSYLLSYYSNRNIFYIGSDLDKNIFPCDLKSHRASYFCGIIEKMNLVVWSAEVLNQLKNIALKHENPVLDEPNVTIPEDKEMKSCQMLSSNALNCVRGQAARAIGHLLWEDDRRFLQEIVSSKASKKIVWSFIHYLEENALSIVDYFSI